KIQSITISTDLGREQLFQLGKRLPYHRYVNFPVDVTCSIETTGVLYDKVSVTEEGTQGNGSNTKNRRIRILTRDGTYCNLGDKNKLSSVSFGGGDATGGNVTITYNYETSNDFT